MTNPTLESKKIILRRCINAVVISIGMQQVLLAVFLLFVNFSLVHPLKWISSTIGLMCSFYTWLSIIPLLVAVILYGIVLGKLHLAEKQYFPTRYRWFVYNAARKLMFLGAHVVLGFVTTSLYSSYLHLDYRQLIYKCYEKDCVNSYYSFLMSVGVFAACYHFVKLHMRNEARIDFAAIHPKLAIQIRVLLFSTLYKSLIKTFLPTLVFTLSYWLVSKHFNRSLGEFFNAELDDRLESFMDMTFNTRLLFYAWILSAQIMSNMNLMDQLYVVFLAQKLPLVIQKNQVAFAASSEISLSEALLVSEISVVQCLAAQYLYLMGTAKSNCERLEIFELSEPGHRPTNWTQLSGQCLNIIQNFTKELTESMNKISAMKSSNIYVPIATASEEIIAEKILLQRYNEMRGIRSIIATPNIENYAGSEGQRFSATNLEQQTNFCQNLNARCEQFSRQIEQTLRNIRRSIPGMVYMFEEPDGAHTIFLLDNSLPIVWITQGLAGICAASISEDRYGVVQVTLPDIIRTLVNLKNELDKLNNININGKRLDRKFQSLKVALKRSLQTLYNKFGVYIREIITDPIELKHLQTALSYQD